MTTVLFMMIILCCVTLLEFLNQKSPPGGLYYSNGFTSITDPSNSKIYKIGGYKYLATKKSSTKKNIKEEIICSICGANLMSN